MMAAWLRGEPVVGCGEHRGVDGASKGGLCKKAGGRMRLRLVVLPNLPRLLPSAGVGLWAGRIGVAWAVVLLFRASGW